MSLQSRMRAGRRRRIRYVTFCPDCKNPTFWTLLQAGRFKRSHPDCDVYRSYRKRREWVMEEVR